MSFNTPSYRRKRPAPRKAEGGGLSIENVAWDSNLDPRERYRVIYRDNDNRMSERVIELVKIGHMAGFTYYGVNHGGRFKTLRADRVVSVVEQLTTGHESSIKPAPSYSTELPPFPLDNAVYKVPTIAQSNRTWTVDLNRYTCACPEKRIRIAKGYASGQLGFVCLHMARAILDNLPRTAAWPPEIMAFLGDRQKVHIDNLS